MRKREIGREGLRETEREKNKLVSERESGQTTTNKRCTRQIVRGRTKTESNKLFISPHTIRYGGAKGQP